MSSMNGIVATLEQVLKDLRRFSTPKHIDQAILDALEDSDLSTAALASLIRRRRSDVLRTAKLMHAAGKIARRGMKWTVDL